MKLLIDQGLPRAAASLLRSAGMDAVHTGEIGLAIASDADILEAARHAHRVVVTLDADFHALLALTEARSPSVIRIRVEGLDGRGLANLLQEVMERCASDIEQGALVTVLRSRIRVRRLPIVG